MNFRNEKILFKACMEWQIFKGSSIKTWRDYDGDDDCYNHHYYLLQRASQQRTEAMPITHH